MLLAMPSGESRNSAKRRLSYSSKSRITSGVQRSPTRSTAPATYAPAENREKLLAAFEDSVTSLRAFLAGLDEPTAAAAWRLTFNDREIAAWSRLTMIRTMGLNHWYHHRGELVVYLRLLG